MTIEQFNELYKILSAQPIVRIDNVDKRIYTTIEYEGKTYLIHEGENSWFIFVGYHADSSHGTYEVKFSERKYFVYHNLEGPAHFMMGYNRTSLDYLFIIHGKLINENFFPKHSLVLLEKTKARLKTKIAFL